MHAIKLSFISSRSDVADRHTRHCSLAVRRACWHVLLLVFGFRPRVGAPRREVRSARFYTHMCRNVELPESTTVCTVGCT